MQTALRLDKMTVKKLRSANLMIAIELEDAEGKAAMQMRDAYLENDPVFVLVLGQPYFLKASVKHKQRRKRSSYNITGIRVKPMDGQWTDLKIADPNHPCAGNDLKATFETALLGSDKLNRVGSESGMPDEKFVTVHVEIDIDTKLEKATDVTLQLTGQIICYMIRPGSELHEGNVRIFQRPAGKLWRQTPQWIKEGAHGALILARTDGRTRTQEDPQTTWVSVICRLFPYPVRACCR